MSCTEQWQNFAASETTQ